MMTQDYLVPTESLETDYPFIGAFSQDTDWQKKCLDQLAGLVGHSGDAALFLSKAYETAELLQERFNQSLITSPPSGKWADAQYLILSHQQACLNKLVRVLNDAVISRRKTQVVQAVETAKKQAGQQDD